MMESVISAELSDSGAVPTQLAAARKKCCKRLTMRNN